MIIFKSTFPISIVACALAVTGCSMGQGGTTSNTTSPAVVTSEPSGGGTTIAEERPGAGVGAEMNTGAAADVPQATQKGAGASDLTEPQQSTASTQTGGASAQTEAAPAQAGGASAPGGEATGSEAAPAPSNLSANAQRAPGQGQTSTNLAIPLYQESLQVGKREVNDGSVRIHKFVTTETANQPIQLRREQVTIDRLPGNQAAQNATAANQAPSQAFQNQDITIQLHHEEPVISKQVVQEGQVVARVNTQLQQTNVQSQLRRDQIEVTKQGNAQNVAISPNLASSGTAVGGGGEVGGQSRGAGGSSSNQPITDPATLSTASDPATLAGRPVNLSGLKVQQVIEDNLITVSGSRGQPLYVRVNQPVEDLKPGDTVNLRGTVDRVPSTPASLGLDQKASQALQGQPIYLDAQQLQVTNQ